MLAYVFWHWPKADDAREGRGEAREGYEARLGKFHAAMAAHPPRGYRRSAVLSITGARWTTPEAYEDWYLVDDFAALGEINEAAISGACQLPHHDVAAGAAGGTAGVYRLIAGDAGFSEVRLAYWISKPAGMNYAVFRDACAGLVARPGVSLWQRQMTLGPTTEFCLQSPGEIDVPLEYSPIAVPAEIVWPR